MNKKLIAVGGSLLLLLGACSKDPGVKDFKSQTEKFLKSDKTVKEQLGVTFKDATCETPAAKSVGTTYTCTGTAEDGSTWTFGVQITKKDSFTVQTYQQGTGTAETTPASGDTTIPDSQTTLPPSEATVPSDTTPAVATT